MGTTLVESDVRRDVRRLLLQYGHDAREVYRVDSPGDACEDATVVLFVGRDGGARTARIRVRGSATVVDVEVGWD